MGAAAHRSGGQLGFVLTATAAAAALYGVVVLFALGPPSPLALGEANVRPPQVVHIRVQDRAVTRPVPRRPQASAGRAQQLEAHAAVPATAPRVGRHRGVLAAPRRKGHTSAVSTPNSSPVATPASAPAEATAASTILSLPGVQLPETPPLPVALLP